MISGTDRIRRPMAEINVTPLVDVVLVLLIIFMVTAPFLQGGFEIDLPKVAARGLDVREGLIVSVRADRTVAVGDAVVPLARLEDELARAGAARRPVFLKADQRVPYGLVVELISRMRRSGVMFRRITWPSSSTSRGSKIFAGSGLPSGPSLTDLGLPSLPRSRSSVVGPSGVSTKMILVPLARTTSEGAFGSVMYAGR